MRSSATSFILQKIGEIGKLPLEAFFPRKYSYARLWRELFGLERKQNHVQISQRSFATILGRLKRQGFIAIEDSASRPKLVLTKEGRDYLAKIRQRETKPQKSDGRGRIVTFDIPEKEKSKRSWLRRELTLAGYEILQKSVWYGDSPLAESFFRELDELRLGPCVHIFEVSKYGTLKR